MNKTIIRIEHPRQSHMVGDGFRVAQYMPGYGREMSPETSPFLMLDYNRPWVIPPQDDHRPGVGFHPHRGFETVTIVYSWEVEHQDTAGNGGVIGPDEVQWMTAGSGLLHNEFMTERFSKRGGMQHAVQLWVDLPKDHKLTTPRYQALTRDNIPEGVFDGGKVRILAWEYAWIKGAADTFSPIELYDVMFDTSETSLQLTFPTGFNTMVLVVEWSANVQDKDLENGDMVYLSQNGEDIALRSSAPNTRLLIMAWKPLEQDVVQYGPFVMTTETEIRQAWADFQAGKMGVVESERN